MNAIVKLQEMMMQMPQADGLETRHYHIRGVYGRWLFRPKGCLIVGKTHKREHLYIVCKGKVQIEDKVLEAGDVIISQPGTKRAVLALEDSICMTVHRTDKKNLDKIERELIEPEKNALFDARNKLKELT